MRVVGFTGTREGMTPAQKSVVAETLTYAWAQLEGWVPDEVHHGGCEGADWDFHEIVRAYLPQTRIVVHPSTMPATYPAAIRQDLTHRTLAEAWVFYGAALVHAPAAPLVRNTRMVWLVASQQNAVRTRVTMPAHGEYGRFIGTPKEHEEQVRSGTWYTVRRVRKAHLWLSLIAPTGELL